MIHYAALGRGEGDGPTVYALASAEGGWEPYCDGAFVSRDGGKTWQELGSPIAAALPPPEDGPGYEFRAVTCQAQDASTAYVGFCRFGKTGRWQASSAGVSSSGIEHSGIIKTTDG